MQCKQACCTYSSLSLCFSLHLSGSPCLSRYASSALILIHAEPLKVNNLHCCQLMQRTCVLQLSAGICTCVCLCSPMTLPHFHQPLHDLPLPSHIIPVDRLSVVDVECCLWCVCPCVSSLQARVKNEILDYKDLAALPKVKAIYEVQQPDLISSSCQPYNRYTSDDRLDTYIYGEVFLWHTFSFKGIIVLFPQ